MKYLLGFLFFLNSVFAFEIKQNNQQVQKDYEYIDGKYITSEEYYFYDDTDLMIKFNIKDEKRIKHFEERYNLKLKSVSVIGYYIYSRDENILDSLFDMVNEDIIQTLKPNWKKHRSSR